MIIPTNCDGFFFGERLGIGKNALKLGKICFCTLLRMNYDTIHLFAMSRGERNRCLAIINDYYRLHLPDFPILKILDVLRELFD